MFTSSLLLITLRFYVGPMTLLANGLIQRALAYWRGSLSVSWVQSRGQWHGG